MARIRIEVPASFSFLTSFPVRITDLNYGGHVGNDTVLSYLHEARVQYLQSLNYTEMNMEGTSLIMSDVAIEYKAEIFYGDTITVYVTAVEFSRAAFELYYKLTTAGDKIVAVAKTGMVCFDYKLRKVAALPTAARQKMNGQ